MFVCVCHLCYIYCCHKIGIKSCLLLYGCIEKLKILIGIYFVILNKMKLKIICLHISPTCGELFHNQGHRYIFHVLCVIWDI